MSGFTFKQAKRRYHLLFWPFMAVYVAIVFGGSYLQHTMDSQPLWLGALLAVATMVPILAVLLIMWRYVQETDEFSRVRQLEGMAIGGLITGAAAGLVGFLQIYDVIEGFPVFFLLPLFFVSYGIAFYLRGGRGCV